MITICDIYQAVFHSIEKAIRSKINGLKYLNEYETSEKVILTVES